MDKEDRDIRLIEIVKRDDNNKEVNDELNKITIEESIDV